MIKEIGSYVLLEAGVDATSKRESPVEVVPLAKTAERGRQPELSPGN